MPLDSVEAVAREDREMSHCVLSRVGEATSGRSYFYKILLPERATLQIERKRGDQGWRIVEVKGAENRRVKRATRVAVEKWLTHAVKVASHVIQSSVSSKA